MCSNLSTCLFIILNSVFLLVGVTLAVIGGFLLWGKAVVEKLLEYVTVGVNMDLRVQHEALQQISTAMMPFGMAVFIVGLVFIMVNILGVVGVKCSNKITLIIYTVIIGLLMVIFASVIIFYFTGKQMFKCCGYFSANDFNNKTANFKTHLHVAGSKVTVAVPLPCCKRVTTSGCPVNPTKNDSNVDTSCREVVINYVTEKLNLVAFITVAPLIYTVILFILAIVILFRK